MSERLTVETLGAKGDGIAQGPGGPAFVLFSLPGEVVEAVREGPRARILALETISPERREPPCPHFGVCGGCDLQHASAELYAAFKRDLVGQAFRRVGIEAAIDPLVPCAPATRRRVVFSASRAGGRVLFGFHEALSHRIAPIQVCLIAVPAIAGRLAVLERLAALLADRKRELRLTVTATPAGLDVAVAETATLDDRLRQRAIGFALETGLARLSVGGETLVEPFHPTLDIGGIAVSLPPGAFIQAVASAEEAMAQLAGDHLQPSRNVADLFAGIGTFALRLARAGAVHAVEGDAPALAALDAARRGARGLKPVTTERRDLMRRPLTRKELARFDGALFDPPRAGAESQAHELAASKVARIAAVSCNPVTLARDAAILVAGGYRLLRVTPIDQFLWSHHVEAVALFER